MELKGIEIVELYKLLVTAKLPKLHDGGQIKLIRLYNTLKSIFTPLEEFEKDAREKLKDDKFDEMLSIGQRWSNGDATVTEEDKRNANNYFNTYAKQINECVKPELEKIHRVEIPKLSEEAFEQLVGANDFGISDSAKLATYLLND